MKTTTLSVLALVLAPAAIAYVSGFNEAGHYIGLGTVLALQLSLMARPVAAFSILLPVLYGVAAVTAASTDGVVALMVALAAAVGAASSQGLHRGLLALLAAALIGSFEPAGPLDVSVRAGLMLAGSTYGFLLASTALRGVSLESRHLHPQSALGYSLLIASVTLVAWFAARISGFPHAWWLPLVILAVSEPVYPGSPREALLRALTAAILALGLVLLTEAFEAPAVRAALLVATMFSALWASRRHPRLLAVFAVPVLVLLASHAASHGALFDYVRAVLPAFLAALAFSGLGHWLFWTLRSGRGSVPA